MMTNITVIKRICAAATLLLFGFCSEAQFSYKYHKTENIKPAASYVPSATALQYGPVLVPKEMPYPGAQIERAERDSKKKNIGQGAITLKNKAQMGAAGPQVLDTVTGNSYSGSVPNDDSFAINRNGIAVSVRNSTIGAYDVVNDSVLFEETLFRFYRPTSFGLPGSKYDPRVIYDDEADRFIVLYLSGTTWQTSIIVTAFSKTNNPVDGFNVYQVEGTPLNDSTWSDYPHLSQSKDDLFITMNTFYNGSTNNSGYVQSTIRQISKQNGYDSLPLTEHYYYDLKSGNQNLFNFTGMSGGSSNKSGPFYVLSNRNLAGSNDSIFVVKITGTAAAGTPQLTMQPYTMENPYGLPPAARQANNHTFDCNDSRIQGGFYQDERIQFVGNTITSNGNSGIYHGMINLKESRTNNIYFKILDFDPVDIGYPQITYTGKSYTETEAIITFNHTGDTLNAGFSTVFFDNDSTYSDFTMVVEGGDYVDVISSNGNQFYERWGDYTGAQPTYGDTGVVWASGYEASSTGQPLTAMVKLRSPNFANAPIVSTPESTLPRDATVAPNPADDWFEISFNQAEPALVKFTLISTDGRQSLFTVDEYAYQGENRFRFNTKTLSPGLYVLLLQNQNGEQQEFKVMVAR